MRYTPTFTCPHCNKKIEANVFDSGGPGVGSGYLGLCGCEGSKKANEASSHLAYEARKRLRRNKK